MKGRKIITLCGSTKFKADFEAKNKELTLAGNIVISVACFGHSGDTFSDEQKVLLDEIHKRKIDIADAIYVINRDGYIGESTKSEIKYAISHGKEVLYMEEVNNIAASGEKNTNPCVRCNTVEIRCKDCLRCRPHIASERLTQWTPNGASLILGEPKSDAEAAAILKVQFKKACNKLAELEDKLEIGQLVDTTPYIVEIKSEIPFKYKVIKPTVHRRNVEMCSSRESAERLIAKMKEETP